jgi:hypothetical protein
VFVVRVCAPCVRERGWGGRERESDGGGERERVSDVRGGEERERETVT